MASPNPQKFLSQLSEKVNMKSKLEILQYEKEIIKIKNRLEEINLTIKRLYEDSVLGRISNERFNILSQDYEEEQKSLMNLLIELQEKISSFIEKKLSFEKFTNIIQKYTDINEFDTVILNELIDKVVIHE